MSDRAQRIERLTRAEPNRFPRRKPKTMPEPEATACSAAALEERVADLEKKLAEAEAKKVPETPEVPLETKAPETPEVPLETKAPETPEVPLETEAPETPDELTRLRVASIDSLTSAFQFRPAFVVV